MKRFWRAVTVVADGGAWGIALDGKPVRTPARAPLILPTRALAEAVAGEWAAQGDEVRPLEMPLTGLSNAAIDRVGPEIAAAIAAYGAHDLTCYRAEGPPALTVRQAAAWDPVLAWAGRRFDVAFAVTAGVAPVAQPAPTLARLRATVDALGPFVLAGLSPLVSVTGSLLLGLAVLEREIDAETAWAAGEVDAAWQAEQWGDDPLALAPREARRADLLAGARLLAFGRPTRLDYAACF